MRPLLFLVFHNFFLIIHCFSAINDQSKHYGPQLYCVTQATQSLIAWNDFLRNDLEALHQDGWAIYSLGIDEQNEFAIHVGKRSLGSYFIRTGKMDNGIQLLVSAAQYFEKAGNYEVLTETLNEIGNGFVYKNESNQAIVYFLRSLKMGKKSEDPTSSFLAEINLAQAYLQLKEYEKANAILQHYKKQALHYKKFEAVSSAYALLGTIAQMNNLNLAKEYFLKSANFGFKSKANGLVGQAYTNYAIALFLENDITQAKTYFFKALKFRLKTKNSKSIAEAYFNLGDYFNQTNQLKIAISYYQKSLTVGIENNLFQDQIDALNSLNECYRVLNDTPNQLKTMSQIVDCQQQKLNLSKQFILQDVELENIMLEDKLKKEASYKIKSLKRNIQDKNKLIFIFSLIYGFLFIGSIVFMAKQSIQASRKN